MTDITERLRARIAELGTCLEIDFVYLCNPDAEPDEDALIRKEISPEWLADMIDGIKCRDETIKLQDALIEKQRAKIAELEGEKRQRQYANLVEHIKHVDHDAPIIVEYPGITNAMVEAGLEAHKRHAVDSNFARSVIAIYSAMEMARNLDELSRLGQEIDAQLSDEDREAIMSRLTKGRGGDQPPEV